MHYCCVDVYMQGNALYREGQYEKAVECYNKGMMLDPLSAVLPANRAMALLKLERYVYNLCALLYTCTVFQLL